MNKEMEGVNYKIHQSSNQLTTVGRLLSTLSFYIFTRKRETSFTSGGRKLEPVTYTFRGDPDCPRITVQK